MITVDVSIKVRYMNDLVQALRRWLPPSAAIVALFLFCSVAIYAVYLESGLNTAIKGGYVLLACAIVLLLLQTEGVKVPALPAFEIRPAQATRLVLALTLLSLFIGTMSEIVLIPVIATLAVGYGLIVVQIFGRQQQRIHLFGQILLVNLILPTLKYLRTGFYGANDTLKHVRYVETLLRDGTPAPIPEVHAEIPGLHILVGSVSTVTNIQPYDALMISGLILFALVLPLVGYFFSVMLLQNETVSLLVAAALPVVSPNPAFATYLFPQVLAFVIGFFILYLAYRSCRSFSSGREVKLVIILSFALVIVHHLSIIILAGLLGFAIALGKILQVSYPRIKVPSPVLLIILVVTALIFWIEVATEFIIAFAFATSSIIVPSSSGSITANRYAFGMTLPEESTIEALLEVFSILGIHYIVLGVIFFFGIFTIFYSKRPDWDRETAIPVLLLGCGASILVMKTPLPLRGIVRMRQVAVLFFTLVVALGCYRIFSRHNWGRAMVAVLLVTAALSGHLIAGTAIIDLDDELDRQDSFSNQEYQQLEAEATFIKHHTDSNVTSDWLSRWMMYRFGISELQSFEVQNGEIATNSNLFLYRNQWTNHEVVFKTTPYRFSSFYMSEEYLRGTIAQENKIYTAGQTGLLSRNRLEPLENH